MEGGGAATKAWGGWSGGLLPRATRRGGCNERGEEGGGRRREGEDDVEEGGDCYERWKREEGSGKGGNATAKDVQNLFRTLNPLIISYRNRINIFDIKRFID